MFQAGSGTFLSSLSGLPWFVLYFLVSSAVLAVFVILYVKLTNHDEVALIRDGNVSAALGLGGTLIGFVIPLAKAVQQSVSIPDMLVWAFAAALVQLLVYVVVRRFVPDLSQRIESGNVAAGAFLGAAAIGTGLLNAAAMSL